MSFLLSKIVNILHFIHITSIIWFGVDFYRNNYLPKLLNNKIEEETNKIEEEIEEETNKIEEETNKTKNKIKYEDKYLIEIRKMTNEYFFTEDELKIEEDKRIYFNQLELNNIQNERKWLQEEINEFKTNLFLLNNGSQETEELNKYIINDIQLKINERIQKLDDLELITPEIIENKSKELARQFIIDEQLKKFKTKFVIEMTPIGNVLLYYNFDKLSFEYYSDNTIPYRYLEVVARKYVLVNRYRPLYLDMEEELKKYELKLLQNQDINQNNNNQNNNNQNNNNNNNNQNNNNNNQNNNNQDINNNQNNNNNQENQPKKKDVFAKFKTYNKEGGSGYINTAPPPKNSIPQNKININNLIPKKEKDGEKEKILLKEKSNRYSYQGKFANFSFLQKVKLKDKKTDLTYSLYKSKLKANKKKK